MKEIGKIGEDRAAEFFENKGYRVIEKNFRSKFGEIDLIISRAPDELVFVEVRSKTSSLWGEPFETVGTLKQKKLYRLAEYYLSIKDLSSLFCRFDVLSILLHSDGKVKKLEHIENAFGM